MYIIWEHRVKCLNVWSGKLEDPGSVSQSSRPAVNAVFVVGNASSSVGQLLPLLQKELEDWTMAQPQEEGHTEADRRCLAAA